jgi:hypothetical protein
MNAWQDAETSLDALIDQDNSDCIWRITAIGGPSIRLYVNDEDLFYSMDFGSRATLERFVDQLHRVADEVWTA